MTCSKHCLPFAKDGGGNEYRTRAQLFWWEQRVLDRARVRSAQTRRRNKPGRRRRGSNQELLRGTCLCRSLRVPVWSGRWHDPAATRRTPFSLVVWREKAQCTAQYQLQESLHDHQNIGVPSTRTKSLPGTLAGPFTALSLAHTIRVRSTSVHTH